MKLFWLVLIIIVVYYISNNGKSKSSDADGSKIAGNTIQTDNTEKFASFGRDKREWKCNDCSYIYQGINNKCPKCGADRALRAMPVDFGKSINNISSPNMQTDNNEILRTTIVSQGLSKYKTKTKTSSMLGRGIVAGTLINPVAGLAGAVTAKKSTEEIKSKDITFAVEYKNGNRKLIKTKVGSRKYKELAKYL